MHLRLRVSECAAQPLLQLPQRCGVLCSVRRTRLQERPQIMVRFSVWTILFLEYLVCRHVFLSTLESFSLLLGELIFKGFVVIYHSLTSLLVPSARETLNSSRALMSFCALRIKHDAWKIRLLRKKVDIFLQDTYFILCEQSFSKSPNEIVEDSSAISCQPNIYRLPMMTYFLYKEERMST